MSLILSIETSCDDTCIAIWKAEADPFSSRCLIDLVKSQDHNKFGGILPEYAARNHNTALPVMVDYALDQLKLDLNDLDTIAVTYAPGLIGSLMVGTSYAKALAWSLGKKIIGIHHVEAHMLIAHYDCKLSFPYGALVASGGHTLLAIVEDLGKYKLLGTSMDDAAGECFDKVAREMGLPQPGGPSIEKLALHGEPVVPLCTPLHKDGTCKFSFSGLKTAAIRAVQSGAYRNEDIAASFQASVANTFVERLGNAVSLYPDVKDWVLVGGVAANKYLRGRLAQDLSQITLHVPASKLCTDNAVMVGYTAVLHTNRGHYSHLALEPISSMNLEELSRFYKY